MVLPCASVMVMVCVVERRIHVRDADAMFCARGGGRGWFLAHSRTFLTISRRRNASGYT